jgi:hypothetical protein
MKANCKRNIKGLIFIVAVFLAASQSLAAEFAGGTGEPNDPYQIATAEQLISIGDNPNLLDKHFVLVNDIDLDPNLPGGHVFTKAVIAPDVNDIRYFQGDAFTGNFDGNGYKIKNLTIQNDTADHIGLFGHIGINSRIKNLGLENVYIIGSSRVGGLAGYNSGTIINCYATGNVSGGYDCENIGGLVGLNNGIITDCHTLGNVTGGNKSRRIGGLTGSSYLGTIKDSHADISVSCGENSYSIGGLVGDAEAGTMIRCYVTGSVLAGDDSHALGGLVGDKLSGNIESCYTTADITGGDNSKILGGLVGSSESVTIINCYATGDISGDGIFGGLIGGAFSGMIKNCYATGRIYYQGEINDYGGLIFANNMMFPAYIRQCFWDTEASGASHSTGGTGLTTVQMHDIQTYLDAGWDFVGEHENGTADIWRIPEGGGYPELAILSEDYQPHILAGSGTPEDPYQIATAEDLGAMNHYNLSACYELVSDIDLSGITWDTSPIPESGSSFNGNSHRIMNLTIDSQVLRTIGLFGSIGNNANVWNLGLENISITVPDNSVSVGGLAGFSSGNINNCYVTGIISCGDNSLSLGLLAGGNHGNITNCYVFGNISAGDQNYFIGALVGDNFGTIVNCYAVTSISAGDNSYIGDLVGDNWGNGIISSSYFLTESEVGGLDNGLGLPLTNEQMKQQASFVDWDFVEIWMICEGIDYPRLQWQNVQCEGQ